MRLNSSRRAALAAVAVLLLGACAGTPTAPYPAFVRTAELPDAFLAGLPGIRAKLLAGNPDTRRSSSVLSLPPDWEFTTGGFPDKSVEFYVLAGNVRLGDIDMDAGGYAYIPPASTGIALTTRSGARLLYFLDDASEAAVIQTPLVTDRDLMNWTSADDAEGFGLFEKVLREDPGSGAKTWLLRIEPGATRPWQSSSVAEEGFLIEGRYTHAECVDGEPVSGEYLPGGYFFRPPDAVNGGPESVAAETSVWYLRRLAGGETVVVPGCS